MTKKQLKIELEKAQNLIEGLKLDIECLEKQRTQLLRKNRKILKASFERNQKAKKEADELIRNLFKVVLKKEENNDKETTES